MDINKIELQNIKRIKKTEIVFKDNISAIYGPNGTGKTTVVDALEILKDTVFRKASTSSFSDRIKDFFRDENEPIVLKYYFSDDVAKVLVTLNLKLENDEVLFSETYEYRESNRAKWKTFYSFSAASDEIVVPGMDITSNLTINIIRKNTKLYTGLDSILEVADESFQKEVFTRYYNKIRKNLHVINLEDQSVNNISNDILVLFFHSVEHYDNESVMYTDTKKYNCDDIKLLKQSIELMNTLIKSLVPGLSLIVQEKNVGKDERGDIYTVELLVERDGKQFDVALESSGVKKIISILSVLIYYYRDEDALVVIDELDAHIYEYLLSLFIYELSKGGEGQLIFTSHNLTLLENLGKNNIILSVIKDDVEFTYFNGVQRTTNMRDLYIRSQSIGNDERIPMNIKYPSKISSALNRIKYLKDE